MADIPGLPARRGALQLLDAVMRRGETLDQAERAALRRVRSFADRARGLVASSDLDGFTTDRRSNAKLAFGPERSTTGA